MVNESDYIELEKEFNLILEQRGPQSCILSSIRKIAWIFAGLCAEKAEFGEKHETNSGYVDESIKNWRKREMLFIQIGCTGGKSVRR